MVFFVCDLYNSSSFMRPKSNMFRMFSLPYNIYHGFAASPKGRNSVLELCDFQCDNSSII